VEDLFDFPANFKSISELVSKLKNQRSGGTLKVPRKLFPGWRFMTRTKPDISHDEKAIRIQLLGKDQNLLADVLVGKQRESSGGAGAQYLKPPGKILSIWWIKPFGLWANSLRIGSKPICWTYRQMILKPSPVSIPWISPLFIRSNALKEAHHRSFNPL
jgi:hypothetical protein